MGLAVRLFAATALLLPALTEAKEPVIYDKWANPTAQLFIQTAMPVECDAANDCARFGKVVHRRLSNRKRFKHIPCHAVAGQCLNVARPTGSCATFSRLLLVETG